MISNDCPVLFNSKLPKLHTNDPFRGHSFANMLFNLQSLMKCNLPGKILFKFFSQLAKWLLELLTHNDITLLSF